MTLLCPLRRAWHTPFCATSSFWMIQKQKLPDLVEEWVLFGG